ncbi:hypothetical protein [Prolixibacter sp. SD074]|jgi:hypothetical protein|uniref:hypothetical protein n=1 Tax=Prolixibacter sp. SD074 TaxID=2652391 RepID=UPI0012746E45|nr:hypothetical protein [Prolixibacter sp. SD074]GET30021.1 hypothetical protein SD074_22230 [Prolixibacter sp. SD074]
MNTNQNKHLRMYLNTQTALDNNTNKWNTLPIMVATKNQYDELIQRIIGQNEKTNPASKGITESKDLVRYGLTEKAVSLSGTMQAFAAVNNDLELAEKVTLHKSDLTRCRETDLEALVVPVITEARNRIEALTDYQVTEDMLVEIETSLDNFKALIGQPRTIRNKAFAAKTVLADLFDKADDLLNNQLDKLMLRYRATNSDFYEEYTRARVIVD